MFVTMRQVVKIFRSLLIISFLFTTNLMAEHSALTHAPIGVMGDHVHSKGEIMYSLRIMRMTMEGARTGTDDLGVTDYTQNIKPLEMDMDMYMLGMMYGITDRITVMPMINFVSNKMDLRNQMMGRDFDTSTSGLGDIKITGLYKLSQGSNHHAGTVVKLGLSIPTGSIDEEDSIPVMGTTRLPYPMQLGSGTWDPSIGVVHQDYFGSDHLFNWGFDSEFITRFGDNDEDYNLGNEFFLNTWLAYQIKKWVSVSMRLNWKWRDDIDGSDSGLTITPAMNPLADPNARGGNWTSLFTGANFLLDNGNRLAFEIGFPVSQNVHGVQMSQDWSLVLGWQYLL